MDDKKYKIFLFLILLTLILFPLIYYPRIYGVDAFKYIWMANALKEGALVSKETWLIHPLSYFGYFPFSHTPIGVPFFLSLLLYVLRINEAVLILDIIMIIFIFISAQKLADNLFKENKFNKLLFIVTLLLSPQIIREVSMTVSPRLVITIIMINLLNINLKILENNEKQKKFKTILLFILLFLIGAFSHLLWSATFISVILLLLLLIIRRNVKMLKILTFLALPICIIAFMIGLAFFRIDPNKISAVFSDNSTLLGVLTNLLVHYTLRVGLIFLFMPIGIIFITIQINNFFKKKRKNQNYFKINRTQIIIRYIYLVLFLFIFSFMAPSFYSIILLLPIVVVFSLYGLIFIKIYMQKISKKMSWVFYTFILIFSIGYSIVYNFLIIGINLWILYVIISIIGIIIIFSLKFFNLRNLQLYIDFKKLKKSLKIAILISSILIFSITNIFGRYEEYQKSPYPWENRYLTEEEIEVIDFLKNEEINGLIFIEDLSIAQRIGGIGFLPAFSSRNSIGTALFYDFITPIEVYRKTHFSFSEFSRLGFFYFNDIDPITKYRNEIIRLNVSLLGDYEVLKFEYKIQYIVSITPAYHLENQSRWILIRSLNMTMDPVFSTKFLFVWKLY
jgi:hypothetical protein